MSVSSHPTPPPLPPWARIAHSRPGLCRPLPPPLPPQPRRAAPDAYGFLSQPTPAQSERDPPTRPRYARTQGAVSPAAPGLVSAPKPTAATATTQAEASSGRRKMFHFALFAAFFAGALALTLRGYDFYSLDLGERVDHPDFRQLGPGSNIGHGYGIAGTLLMLTNLLYLLRRRFARLSVGSLRIWLDIHVFTGLFGGLLALFHSAFQVRSSIAWITVVSLGAVLFTGLIGRYLHALAPASSSAALEQALTALEPAAPGLAARLRQQLASELLTELARPSLMGALRMLPVWRRQGRRRARLVEQELSGSVTYQDLAQEPLRALRRALKSQARSRAAGALLRSWRGVHRLSALVLVAVVGLHIAVAWYFGFVWVFSA